MNDETPEARDLLVHVHIPKCGGTSFNTILTHLYGKDCALDYGLLWNYQYDRRQFLEITRLYPQLKAVASHRFSLDLPWDEPGLHLHPISFVRDPVARVTSWYFYTRFHKTLGTRSRDLSLTDYCRELVERPDDDDARMLLDGQVRFLAGEASEDALQRILTLIERGRVRIFPVERFDEACLLLETHLPALIPDAAYARKNVSRRDQQVDPEVERLLAPHIALDRKLRESCIAAMERALEETPVADRIDAFARRCARFSSRQKGVRKWWHRSRRRWAGSLKKRLRPHNPKG